MSTEVTKSFTVASWTVLSLFQRPGAGLYIPVYQRPYSWYKGNIETLLSDICEGVQTLGSDSNSLSFLGTLILLPDPRKEQVAPKDQRAVPSEVLIIIDGQQRLTTLAIIGCALHAKLEELRKRLPEKEPYRQLQECVQSVQSNLYDLWTLDLKRGSPPRKPKLIRAQRDVWTYDGPDSDSYKSDIASFLSSQIRSMGYARPKGVKSSETQVQSNYSVIQDLLDQLAKTGKADLDDEVELAVPSGAKLAAEAMQQEIWDFNRPDLAPILQSDAKDLADDDGVVCGLARLLSVTNYLLRRCCMTVIQPDSERWAFDMFQSLNATGSPLTSLETFKPSVVRSETTFQGSVSETAINRVERLFEGLTTSVEKTSKTNELLRAFALMYSGDKLSNRFSYQRSWLEKNWNDLPTNDRRQFLREMANLADYISDVWEHPEQVVSSPPTDPRGAIAQSKQSSLAGLLLAYLADANHKITLAPIGRYYSSVLDAHEAKATTLDASAQEFVEALKVLSAFYTIWRAGRSNSGLDKEYRDAMSSALCFKKHPSPLDAKKLADHFAKSLKKHGYEDKKKWVETAGTYLTFSSAKFVCRFCLFVAADDTIPDDVNPGLVKPSMPGVQKYLTHEHWKNAALADIEHVAPQKPTPGAGWDSKIYDQEIVNRLGNLTLLPKRVNASVSNREWGEKLLYYQHLGVSDPAQLASLKGVAASAGYKLDLNATKILTASQYAGHLAPIACLTPGFSWDSAFIERRTACLLSLVWDKISPWIFR